MKLQNFQQVIADHLLYFDEREWPDSGDRIPLAPSLPVAEHYDTLPPVDPACTPAMPGPVYGRYPLSSTPVPSSAPPGPSIATPDPSSATPGPSSATPLAVRAEEEAAGNPELPQAAAAPAVPVSPYHSRMIVYHPDRLDCSYGYELERVRAKRQQRRYRVCQQQSICVTQSINAATAKLPCVSPVNVIASEFTTRRGGTGQLLLPGMALARAGVSHGGSNSRPSSLLLHRPITNC